MWRHCSGLQRVSPSLSVSSVVIIVLQTLDTCNPWADVTQTSSHNVTLCHNGGMWISSVISLCVNLNNLVTIDVQNREFVPTKSLAKLCLEEDGTIVHVVICKQTNCLGTDYAFSQKRPRIQKVPGPVWACIRISQTPQCSV